MRDFGFQWHLTDRCNLRCVHCYQSRFDSRMEKTLEELCSMAEVIFSALQDRTISINLTGGEPLLLPHFFDLLDFLNNFDNLEEVNIITNGTRADNATLDGLGGCEKLGIIKVSLESTDLRVNDSIRGRGNLSRISTNLDLFLRTGKSVILMVTLSRKNLGSILPTLEWAHSRGLDGVIFERFIPLGRGRRQIDQVLTAKEWATAVLQICKSSQAGGLQEDDLVELLAYRAFWVVTTGRAPFPLQGALCNLGDESMALMPDGSVYPCRRLPCPVGRVLTDPFEIILRRLGWYGLSNLKPRLESRLCGACDVDGCMGCRALAFALTGDVLADDPQCLRPSAPTTHRE